MDVNYTHTFKLQLLVHYNFFVKSLVRVLIKNHVALLTQEVETALSVEVKTQGMY